MSPEVDEDEHSLEMQYPYIRHVWKKYVRTSHKSLDVRVVPLLVGSLSPRMAERYAQILEPYAVDPATMFVVSSDFCHWGMRFRYTRYQAGPSEEPVMVDTLTPPDVFSKQPIYASITDLDSEAMSILSFSYNTAAMASQNFREYIQRTRNTICGKHPILLILTLMALLEKHGQCHECRFTYYAVCLTN